jgi:transcriptional regulator with XRE-family HTH domain
MKRYEQDGGEHAFQKRLRQIRTQRGLTTKKLGELIGRTDIQIQRYERIQMFSSQQPSLDAIRELCIALQCSPEWLLGIKVINCLDDPEDGVIYQYSVETRGVNNVPTLVWTCPNCNMCNIHYDYKTGEFIGVSCEYDKCNKVFHTLYKQAEQ